MNLSNRVRALTYVILVLWFPLLASCAHAQGTGPTSQKFRFISGNSARNIAFEEDDGHIFLQARINNSAPLWFGLDTGATRSIIDKSVAQSLGLKAEGRQQVEGAGGYEDAAIFNGISIKLPGVEIYDQKVWGLSLDSISAGSGRRIDGIIGYELFKYFVVDIDYVGLRLNLHEPQKFHYRGAGHSVPLRVQPDGAIYVQAKLDIAGRNPIEGEFVIDTGGNSTLMLARTFVEQNRLLESAGQTIQAGGGGVGGQIQVAFGRLNSLRLGPFVLNNPLTGYVKVGEIADEGKAGNIGGKALRRFRIVFDYSRQRMTLEPNANFSAADEFDMTGAAILADGPSLSTIKVVRVRPNSPAGVAGLSPMDEIAAVDGHPIRQLARIRQLFRQHGREYMLTIKRGDRTFQVKIKLKRII